MKGRVILDFDNGICKTEFEGEVTPMDIQLGVYTLRMDYNLSYLQRRRIQELIDKKIKDLEEAKEKEASKEITNDKAE